MKIFSITHIWFDEDDYKVIRKQLKEKKIKMKDLAQEVRVSRTHLYDMLVGNKEANILLCHTLARHEILFPISATCMDKLFFGW